MFKQTKLKFYPKTDHFRDLCATRRHGIRNLSDARGAWICRHRVGDVRIIDVSIFGRFPFVQCRRDKRVRRKHCGSLFERSVRHDC